jgi:osmotically inducible protein OsmC
VSRTERRADIAWDGALEKGTGSIWGNSKGFKSLLVSRPARTQEAGGWTSPEELLAAAHAADYAMALAGVLERDGIVTERLDVASTCALDEVDGTHTITALRLSVLGTVRGVTQEEFARAAGEAEGLSALSNALRGTVEISVEPTLRNYRTARGTVQ